MKASAAALIVCLILAGCLLPDSYTAEVEIGADGSFSTQFTGDMAHLTGLRDFKAGRIDAEGLEKAFAEALVEVSGVTADTPAVPGIHTVSLGRRGSLTEGVTAIPGPARFLLIERKGDTAVVATPVLTPYQLKQLKGFGRPSRGSVCLRTDAEVISHNASATPSQAGDCYRWELDLLAGGGIEMRLRLAH